MAAGQSVKLPSADVLANIESYHTLHETQSAKDSCDACRLLAIMKVRRRIDRNSVMEAAAEVADRYCCEPCRDKPEFAAAARTEIAAEIRKLKEKP